MFITRIPSILLAVTFLAVCPSFVFAQGEQVNANLQNADEGNESPIQIAQYPGAPFEDRNGNLWFATVLEGVFRFDGKEFVNFTKKDGLGSDMIRNIVQDDDGTIWIATTNGLTKYDGASFTMMTKYGGIKSKAGFSEHGFHRDLWDILIDKRGELWITTMDGVFQFDGDKFSRFPMPVIATKKKFEFTPKMVYCVYEDKDGDLWFGTDGAGVVRYNGKTTVVYTSEADGLSSDNVCKIYQDSRGDYWFGTSNGGVSRYDGNTFTTHLRNKEYSKHTGWGRFMSIFEDRQRNVWFGASQTGGGVYRYDGNSFVYLSEKDGLGTGGVPSIREDRSGNIWFGTTTGVYYLDGEKFINFTKNNPQLPKRFNEAKNSTETHELNPALLEDWASETFDLPPGFAPQLPNGSESLLFAPGWRDPSSENFWSYAFVMSIDEDVPDAKRVTELLEQYYNGLMSVFASNRGKEDLVIPTQVELTIISTNQYEAKMHLVDAFATFEPVDIRVLVETVADTESHSLVIVQLSKQPKEHTVWRSLQAAIESIQFSDDK